MTAGRPGHDPGHRPLRGIPRSRAFWELKAEQMMNRLFEPEPTLEIHDATAEPALTAAADKAPPPPHRQAEAPRLRRRRWRPGQAGLLVAALGGLGLVSALASALWLTQWNRMQQSLTQERNLLLLERLRNFGPATAAAAPPAPVTPPAPVLPPPASAGVSGPEGLPPPPPPEEPWMQQLSQLPGPGGGSPAPSRPAAAPLRVPVSPALAAAAPRRATPAPGRPAAAPLRVPVSPALAAAAPRRATPATPPGPMPVLVGVVAAPGRAGSAIFQVGALSTSAAVGEPISGSAWRLRSTGSDSAVIEHDGISRTLTVGNGG